MMRADGNLDRYGLEFDRLAVGDNFNPEAGFIQRNDFRRTHVSGRFSPRPKNNKRVRKYYYQASMDRFVDRQGEIQSRNYNGYFSVEMQNTDRITAQFNRSTEQLVRPFRIYRGVTLPVGRYDFQTANVTLALGNQRALSGTVGFEIAGGPHGRVERLIELAVEPEGRRELDGVQHRGAVGVRGGHGYRRLTGGSRGAQTHDERRYEPFHWHGNADDNSSGGNGRTGTVAGGRIVVTGRRLAPACVVALAAVLAVVPLPAAAVERWYATGAYPFIERALTTLSGVTPVAWFDVWLVVALGWLGWTWGRAVRAPRGSRIEALGRAAWRTVVAVSAAYLAFLACWGLNYRREPLAARLELARPAPDTADIVALGALAVRQLGALHAPAHRQGWPGPDVDDARLRAAAAHVQALLGVPRVETGRLKPTLLGWLFRWEGVDAMTNPFGLDILRNPDLVPVERPFVAAHEWAHLAGFANEAEANFIGWLTCLHGDTRSQYSGWLFLYWQVAGELPPAERDALAATLPPPARADRDAIAARLTRGIVPVVQQAGWAAYDQYLKANRVDSGVRSYGEVLTLIHRTAFDSRWRPVRTSR
jgi:hypothetical protein